MPSPLRHRRQSVRTAFAFAGLLVAPLAFGVSQAPAAPPNAFPFPDLITPEQLPAALPSVRENAAASIVEAEPVDVPASESYVLLRNDNLLVGRVLVLGEQIEIKRGDGSVIRIPRSQVGLIAVTLDKLVEHRTNNRFASDIEGIQRDVRWYLRNDMIRQAAKDALLARSIDPNDFETQRLLKQIAARLRTELDRATNPNSGNDGSVQTVSHESPVSDDMVPEGGLKKALPDLTESLGIDEESLYFYQARVQPIFMNRCSGCHSKHDNNERAFQFHPPTRARWAPESTARDNIAEILQFVDRQNPQESEIRNRALDGHAGPKHTFGKSDSPMMRYLDLWLSTITETASPTRNANIIERPESAPNPWATDSAWNDSASYPPATAANTPSAPNPWADEVGTVDQAASLPPHDVPHFANAPLQRISEKVDPSPTVENPFDPSIFNRRFHSDDSPGTPRPIAREPKRLPQRR
ncbi:hypothetical protein [Rhodopirellula sp. MGV]|uniref:hypothetical protein n=1 Tax=Rhodopirellula sp. MGV TaxID=2023130 RepID=UPI000B974049|nr:hypothetical protein [Rhodopirellula sp. MGV]OYP28944.1 hypothetical protein CGZ80_25605 [Rhodopirellula sp. MGV]PNY36939.1 hypothetical protein C2E31_10000 [Rhodopirellula baltica]